MCLYYLAIRLNYFAGGSNIRTGTTIGGRSVIILGVYMPVFGMGNRITFTGEAQAELFGVGGVIVRARRIRGHYVYDIKLSVHPMNTPGLNLTVGDILVGVPRKWIELCR